MKIIKLLYLKYILSISICLIASFVIFFIFSLIGNLNEDYLFHNILNVSILNSLQIITYVPIFIFLISIILLSIFLRSKNEIVIIKSYISAKKLIIFFLPIVLVFTALEMSKKDLTFMIENLKTDLLNENSLSTTKILINENENTKKYTVFNNIDLKDLKDTEYRFYKVHNNKIVEAEFSDDLSLTKSGLIANSYTVYNNEIIKDQNTKKLFKINFSDITNQNFIIKNISKKNNFYDIKRLNLFFFSILLLTYIFLLFFDKKYVSIKQNLTPPILISLTILVYSIIIFNNSFYTYKQHFELLACIISSMLILKLSVNE